MGLGTALFGFLARFFIPVMLGTGYAYFAINSAIITKYHRPGVENPAA
jgi:hypothetical protein